MWCCFKPPDTKIELVNIPKWLNNPETLDACLEDPPTPITAPDSTEVFTDMVEPFVLDHSTILMTECEKPIN